jgi:ankyrin repeat protein
MSALQGRTPLHLAAGSGHHECALLLLRMGAQVCVTVTPPLLWLATQGTAMKKLRIVIRRFGTS